MTARTKFAPIQKRRLSESELTRQVELKRPCVRLARKPSRMDLVKIQAGQGAREVPGAAGAWGG